MPGRKRKAVVEVSCCPDRLDFCKAEVVWDHDVADEGDGRVVERGDGVVEAVGCSVGAFVIVRWRVGEHGEASKDFCVGFLLQLCPLFLGCSCRAV